jgi:multidrug efflux pump subunit AcrB
LLGFIVVGPLTSIIVVSVVSWLMTRFPLPMKPVALAALLVFLVAGAYYSYSRGLIFDALPHRNSYQYTLQSNNLDDLHRFAPMIEAQMRGLAALNDVSLNSQIERRRALLNGDNRKAMASDVKELPTMTISFSLAPKAALVDAIAQIHDVETRLALPPTLTTSLAKAE